MTRCMRPVRPWKKASSRAAASPCCALPSSSRACAPRTTTRRPASRSCARRCPGRLARSRSTRARTAPSSSARSSRKDQYAYGFDSQTGEYGNLVTKGIIDPTKVVRAAIQNAASVAALLITTEAMVAELPKKNARRRRHAPGRRHGRHGLLIQPFRRSSRMQNPGSDAGVFTFGYKCARCCESSHLALQSLNGSNSPSPAIATANGRNVCTTLIEPECSARTSGRRR